MSALQIRGALQWQHEHFHDGMYKVSFACMLAEHSYTMIIKATEWSSSHTLKVLKKPTPSYREMLCEARNKSMTYSSVETRIAIPLISQVELKEKGSTEH